MLAIFCLLGARDASAQQRVQFKLGYNPSFPVGGFSDFMNKNSFRGFLGEIAHPVADRIRVGLGVSYNDFYEKHPRAIHETTQGTVSAVITNSIQTTPIQAKGYYDLTDGKIRPYIGVGVGGNLSGYAQYWGEFGEKEYKFKPSFSGDAGINIPFNDTRASGLNIGGHFNFLPFKEMNIDNLNNWGVHAAVYFPLR